MKTILKIIAISTLANWHISTLSYAIDTLRYYDPDANLVAVSSTTYPYQVARFDLPEPGNITAIILTLGGSTGSAQVHLFGHEAGTFPPYSILQNDLITPVTINKTVIGNQQIKIDISPSVYLANNQFFIAITNFSSGVELMEDNIVRAASCESTWGGTFYYQYKRNASNNWFFSTKAYAIDIIIDYPQTTSPSYFVDVTTSVGIDSTRRSRHLSADDFNNDGFIDLLIDGKLYKNNKDGTFTEISDSAGIIGKAKLEAFIDMNNDGLLDIIYLRSGADNENKLFLNNGDETFTQYIISGIPTLHSYAYPNFSIADLNNDKYPDIFIGQVGDVSLSYLLYNDQNFDFTDESARLYASAPQVRETRGSCFVDFDDDGDLDLYVANYRLQRDEFWQNNGDGTFTNIIAAKGIDVNATGSNHDTGVDWYDYDNDGDMDLLSPRLAHPTFMLQWDHRGTTIYRNEGPPNYNFTDLIGTHGIEYEETHAGATWGDVNNDGLVDFFITAFYGCRYVDLYMQKQDHTFELKTFDYDIQNIVTGRDALWLDYDNDGNLDLLSGKEERVRLFKNVGQYNNNFSSIDLKSTSGNHFAIGARVVLYAGGKKYTQELTAGRGKNMQDPSRLHFGLGTANTLDSVVVRWPNGQI